MTNPLIATYDISTGLAGAPTLKIHLLFDDITETVLGWGRLTQAVNPPLEIKAWLTGSFLYPLVNGAAGQCIVFLKGVSMVKWPKYGGIGPELPTVIDVTLNLNANRTEGTANYAYLGEDGKWHEQNGVPVKASPVAPYVLK